MLRLVALVFAVAIAFAPVARAHSWMTSPLPRSGGTENGASENPTCGSGSGVPAATSVAFVTGATFPVSVMRANNHGTSLVGSVYYCGPSAPSNPTTIANCFTQVPGTSASNAVWTKYGPSTSLSTTSSSPQSLNFALNYPTGNQVAIAYVGVYGSTTWYDCAVVNLLSTANGNPCAQCDTNAACTAAGTCVCNGGYCGSGTVCHPIISSYNEYMTLTISGNATALGVQAPLTNAIASFVNLPASQILYNTAVVFPTNPVTSTLYFAIAPDPITCNQELAAANQIINAVALGTQGFIPYTVVGGGTLSGVTVPSGQYSSGSSSKAWIAAAVLVPLFVIAVVIIGFWYWRKRKNSGNPISNPCAGLCTPGEQEPDKSYVGVSSPSSATTTTGTRATGVTPGATSAGITRFGGVTPGNTSTTNTTNTTTPTGYGRFGGTTAAVTGNTTAPPASRPVPGAWTAEKDDSGHVYYFNHQTGESTWEKPVGVYVPPPK